MRRQAKAVNFGVIYGQSPFGLAKQLGIDQGGGGPVHRRLFPAVSGGRGIPQPGTGGMPPKVVMLVRSSGGGGPFAASARMPAGQRNLPERTAINTVIQGSAADLIKQAMIAIHRRLRRERLPARMLLQIHDELVFEVPARGASRRWRTLVAEEMAGAPCNCLVPLKVDVKVDVELGRRRELGRALQTPQWRVDRPCRVIGILGRRCQRQEPGGRGSWPAWARACSTPTVPATKCCDCRRSKRPPASVGATRCSAPDGRHRPAELAKIVFAPPPDGPQEREYLEQLTHPEIGRLLQEADPATGGGRAAGGGARRTVACGGRLG